MAFNAMDELCAEIAAQARKTVIRETKLAARRFIEVPIDTEMLVLVHRWFGQGGEVPLLNAKGARLYARYRSYVAHVRAMNAISKPRKVG